MKKIFLIIFLFSLSHLLFAQNNNDNQAIMQSNQDGDEQYNLYFNTLLKSKRYEEAEKAIKKLPKQGPAALKYEVTLGRAYKEEGQQENAAKTFDHVINSLPKEESAIRDLANDLYQLEEFDMAIRVFVQGRKILNDEKLFTYELISLYRYKKDKILLVQEYLNALSATPQMLQRAETTFSALFEGNADYLILQNALFKRMQKEPQNESFAKLLIWQYLQQHEYNTALLQLIAQDKRTKDDGTILFQSARLFTTNKAYETAIKAYEYLLSKGKDNHYYLPSRLGMVDVSYQLLLKGKTEEKDITNIAGQYQSILNEYGKNVRTLFALRKWATIQAYYLHHLEKAEEALETAIKIPNITSDELGEIKLELADVYVLTGEPWEAILLYGQVAASFENQDAGNEAKYRLARLSFFQGNFTYAKSQADVLKASTSQLIANDALNLSLLLSDHLETISDTLALKKYASAELLRFRNLPSAALKQLDSIPILYPQNSLASDILMAKSNLFIQTKDFGKAAALLKELISSTPKNRWTDDALFILAGLYENQLDEPEQAKIWYQRLITDFPGSMFTAEARKHFRKLRGDNIES